MAEQKSPPTQEDAEAAVRTLIEWAGDDPAREGLLETPKRVAKAYRELFAGYETDPREYLARTFEEVVGNQRNSLGMIEQQPTRPPLPRQFGCVTEEQSVLLVRSQPHSVLHLFFTRTRFGRQR